MADSEDRMLSQQEIDALLSSNPQPKPPTVPAAAPASAPKPSAASGRPATAPEKPVTAAAPGEVESLKKTIVELTGRLSKLEGIISRFDQLEKKLDSNNGASSTAAINGLDARIAAIEAGLKDSLNYKIRQKFECGNCHTKGFVAVNVRCTKCGKETWSGWYPKKA